MQFWISSAWSAMLGFLMLRISMYLSLQEIKWWDVCPQNLQHTVHSTVEFTAFGVYLHKTPLGITVIR